MGLWSKKNKETVDQNSKTEPVDKDMKKENEMKSEEKEDIAAEEQKQTPEDKDQEATEEQKAPEGKEPENQEEKKEADSSAKEPDAAEQLEVMTDRYARLLADFDNFRKRMVREREEQTKRANENLLSDLLPVLDNLTIALSKAPDPKDPVVTGMRMVNDQFLAILDKYGMKPIDAKGKVFDPAIHEALTQMPSETVPAQTVIEQFRCGWTLGGRLLRPAQVIVSSGAPEAPAGEAAPEKEDAQEAPTSDEGTDTQDASGKEDK